MTLQELIEGNDYEVIQGELDVEIKGINYDSREVKSSELFVCIVGLKVDGHKYANEAIKNGAVAIICEEEIDCENVKTTVIRVKDCRKILSIVASKYYDYPYKKLRMIGVTGTNGKTTTTFMIKSILEENGDKVGLVGTIANYIGSKMIPAERTTPESLELQKLFDKMVKEGCKYCVMEVSSHSLALNRVYGIDFEIGIFTNMTRDHLDFHKTFEHYYQSKYKLFKKSCISIINVDDNYGRNIVKDLNINETVSILTYSINSNSNFKAYDNICEREDSKFKVRINSKEEELFVALPGKFNIYNSLGAIVASYSLGIPLESIKKGLSKVVVIGRCEKVGKEWNLPYSIIIDYAHTPDGLENILKTARGFTKNKLISVFGCGGDRDKVKRPQMGKIGTELSDKAIITSDNPRTEEPQSIIDDIKAGIEKENYEIIENRTEAIRRAIKIAKDGDVIVIAGKGHETYQELKKGKIHFDEREIVDKILKEERKGILI